MILYHSLFLLQQLQEKGVDQATSQHFPYLNEINIIIILVMIYYTIPLVRGLEENEGALELF